MGVCGCGKTTIGRLLSEQLGWEFFDGDEFHPQANVDKMAAGTPLDDDDRRPWLESLRRLLDQRLADGQGTVVACSALKHSYRAVLDTERPDVLLVHLTGSREMLTQRLRDRQGHFMPVDLLDSQLATLEVPGESALRLDVDATPEALCRRIEQAVIG